VAGDTQAADRELTTCTLRAPRDQEWDDIARLVAAAIPSYLVSQLGPRFGASYYRHLADNPKTFSIAAYDDAGKLGGIILGTLDRQAVRRLKLPVIARLLLAANIRLLQPAFLGWLTRGGLSKVQGRSNHRHFPHAELIIFAVSPDFQGQGLASRLLAALEDFFRDHQLQDPYLILTEKTNLAANRFYEKIGASYVHTYKHHGREINEWHKALVSDQRQVKQQP